MSRDMPPFVQALAEYMTQLSEEGWYAKWEHNLEFELWDAVQVGPRRYGHLDLTQEHLNKLQKLSADCNGWIMWHPETERTYVSLAEWQPMFAAWRDKRLGSY